MSKCLKRDPIPLPRRNPFLIAFWDNRIRTKPLMQAAASWSSKDKFTQLRKSALLWKRAQDMYLIGWKNKALNEMLALISAASSSRQLGQVSLASTL